MTSVFAVVSNALQPITLPRILIWLGFLYVVKRAMFYLNMPTIEDTTPKTEAQQKAIKHKNHVDRLWTALFYVPFVPGAAILEPFVFAAFLIIMNIKGIAEYLQIMAPVSEKEKRIEKEKLRRNYTLTWSDRFLQLAALLLGIAAAFSGRYDIYCVATFFCVTSILTFHMLLARQGRTLVNRDALVRLALNVFGFMWIPWNASHALLFLRSGYPYIGGLLAVMLWTSWLGDGAAFYVGSRYGRHKAFPHVSPNKSWEGIGATTFFSVVLCLFFKWCQLQGGAFDAFNFPPISAWHYVAVGLIIAAMDIVGDVCESYVKRLGDVKDSGTFFAGHGGICDRFDSFYFVTPVTMFYLNYVILGNW